MKKYGVLLGCLLVGSVYAQPVPSTSSAVSTTPPQATAVQQKNFDQIKQKQLDFISQRIAKLQELQTCVQATTELTQMRQCHEKFKQERLEKKK